MLSTKMVGSKIAEARKKINISQAELAQRLFISSQAVGKWERGESMPDITTFNRMAELLGVDLNYFSDSFNDAKTEINGGEARISKQDDLKAIRSGKKLSRDMSEGNWADADFSGLKNLREKFSSSNMKNCKFIGSDFSGLLLEGNNVDACDFTGSDISKCQIRSSMIGMNRFVNASLADTEFAKCHLNECDFSGADLSGTGFNFTYLMKLKMANAKLHGSSFKDCGIQDIDFEGIIEDCSFENCRFHDVRFRNATLLNTFFKNNRKFKNVQFVNCKADSITYAFLKSNQANLEGVTLIPSV